MNPAHGYSEGAEVPEDKTPSDNELIAEFMGALLERPKKGGALWAIYNLPEFCKRINIQENKLRVFYSKDLEFDRSWDWLMPVVEKIHKMGKMVTINFYDGEYHPIVTKIYSWGLGDDIHEREQGSKSAIESVYKAVVEFIKWYNLESLKNKPI